MSETKIEQAPEVVETTTRATVRPSELARAILGIDQQIEFEASAGHKFEKGQHVHGKDIDGHAIPRGSVVDHYDAAGHVIVEDPTHHTHTCNEADLDFDHADHH